MTTRNSLLRSLLALMFCTVIAGFSQSSAPLGPAPGKMIDVDGHKLHIHCVGPHDAKPAVILEAGGGTFSRDWAAVQRLLAERVRTCAYDRAGPGWSDLGPAPRTLAQEVFELHTLLESAKISGPFVLVGQSLVALYVLPRTMGMTSLALSWSFPQTKSACCSMCRQNGG